MEKPDQAIEQFLSARRFAVAGASEDPEKYGHMCFVALRNAGFAVYPLNPRAKSIVGVAAYPNLAALPERVESLSIVTPPAVTERLLEDAVAAGVQTVWMQPGAEPEQSSALAKARDAGLNLIYGGPCLLVELAVRRRRTK